MMRTNLMKTGILGMLFLALTFVGCNNDDDNDVVLKKKKYTVTYTVNSNKSTPIFNTLVTYKNKDGKDQNAMLTEYPWTVSFEVEAPFTAKFSGKYMVKSSAEIPEKVIIAKDASFKITQGKDFSKSSESKSTTTLSKEKFNELVKKENIGFNFKYEIKK